MCKRNAYILLVVALILGPGCTRVRLAQRIGIVKANYDQANFARVLGYAREGQLPENNNLYDPPGNYTVHEVRLLVVKETGSADYNYSHLFDPSLSTKTSIEKQDYLRQLALIELRALVHQYFSTHAPPYRGAAQHPFVTRAKFLLERLSQLDFPRSWERAEILACQGDLAVLDGQYEVAQAAYSVIFTSTKDLPDAILGQYAKRYILSFERAAGTATVSKDAAQETALMEEFEATLEKIADLIPSHPVGIYAKALWLAESRKPLQSYITALLSWRRSGDQELRTLLDQFVQLKLEDYWPLIKNDPSFRKLIMDQWEANKRSTSGDR